MKKTTLCAAMVLGLATGAHASEQEGWQVELTPYFWGANVDADLRFGDQKYDIDNDLTDNLDSGFMGLGIISYDRFVLYLDYDYLSTSDDAEAKGGGLVPRGTRFKSDNDLSFATGGIGWRFDTWGEHSTIDVLVGVRNARLELELKGNGTRFKKDDDVTDPLLILRPSIHISDNWRFNPTLAYGAGGDSDSTYELMPQFQYRFSDYFALRFGYKRIYYDTNSGHDGSADYREFDGSFSGPFIGLGWLFPAPGKPAPVARAVEPPPPPPPPAKCADTDGDGVCDDADQCPNTPRGKRVGPAGCDCDYTLITHFAFDSARLTEEDKVELDRLAEVLVNPKLGFVTGKVDGYTDSVGKPEYNQKLSERRAQAVADYLQAKGVSTGSRMTVQGFGESDPVADNTSAEGRAENRRVVIRRTDCGS